MSATPKQIGTLRSISLRSSKLNGYVENSPLGEILGGCFFSCVSLRADSFGTGFVTAVFSRATKRSRNRKGHGFKPPRVRVAYRPFEAAVPQGFKGRHRDVVKGLGDIREGVVFRSNPWVVDPTCQPGSASKREARVTVPNPIQATSHSPHSCT